ncbi:MAG: response regulator [Planctomycetota bacterium]
MRTGGQPIRSMDGRGVLVVDDCADTRRLMRLLLAHEGALVSEAEDGRDALRTVLGKHQQLSLILMDVIMPVIDGLTATRVLRERGVRVPIIAVTASIEPAIEQQCFSVGCSGYFSKPIDRSNFLRVCRYWSALRCGGRLAA